MGDQRSVDWVVCEINEDMKKDVEQVVNKALDDPTIETEKQIAAYIKSYFDKKYAPNWHCVVGKSFASYVTYSSKHYIFFYIA